MNDTPLDKPVDKETKHLKDKLVTEMVLGGDLQFAPPTYGTQNAYIELEEVVEMKNWHM